ncbi:ATP-binding cassette domain-containing protein [Arthrobacter sp. FW306-05-C]|uniref:ABC transporter ATP-binding protein n=1 Tax=unclassified Arthrobacter TaxID=235627 RepID=UPI001F002386|nr:ATP-binding cassette domain-containing protein [Arthrobacter sp. FW306-05-C]UKA66448.1 ATP-binding cassette domain-containing protein [Arthrobacter sp. FW306-05-C]
MNHRPVNNQVLELDDVSFRRDGRDIISGITLSVKAGEHWALLGANGAGKSTLMGLCGAVNHPSSGTVSVLGERLGRVELKALRQSIGHVNPRHQVLSPLTVRQVVLTGLTGSNDLAPRWEPTHAEYAKADELVEQFGLAHKAGLRWPTLSQGERGRALIARALISSPELLLLDEPCTGLDIAAREQLLETIDDLAYTHPQMASVLVTHHLEELPATTSHALLITAGQAVAAGPAAGVITSENISAAFGHPIDVEYRHQRWSARTGRSSRRGIRRQHAAEVTAS